MALEEVVVEEEEAMEMAIVTAEVEEEDMEAVVEVVMEVRY